MIQLIFRTVASCCSTNELLGFALHQVDLAQMRDRLALSEGDVGRQQQRAARAEAEGGGAVAQLHALRVRVSGGCWGSAS